MEPTLEEFVARLDSCARELSRLGKAVEFLAGKIGPNATETVKTILEEV